MVIFLTSDKIMNNPFFLIMLPTFNRPDLVLRSVESIISQKYERYKLVIFNDGSTKDYSALENLIKNHPNVEYIKSENIGINKSRNIMLTSFLKNDLSDNSYFFTMSDDDYLIQNSLSQIASEIKNKKLTWYCFNCESKSQKVFKNNDYLNYEVLRYHEFRKKYRGDKHFVFKLNKFKNIRFPDKYFKNGYEYLFYHQIPSPIQTIPLKVKVIEYFDDGLTLSDLYDNQKTFDVMLKEIKTLPFNLSLYINFIKFYLKPKNIVKLIISDEKYYEIKVKLGFRDKRKNKKVN